MKRLNLLLSASGLVLGVVSIGCTLTGRHELALSLGSAGFVAALVSLLRRATP